MINLKGKMYNFINKIKIYINRNNNIKKGLENCLNY